MSEFADKKIRGACEHILSGAPRPVSEVREISYYRMESSFPEEPNFSVFRAVDSELDDVIPLGWKQGSADPDMNRELDSYFSDIHEDLFAACKALLSLYASAGGQESKL